MSALDWGLVYCAFVWGSTFIVVKRTLAYAPAGAMVGYRFLIAALCLLPWALRRPSLRRHAFPEGALLAFWLILLYLTQTEGLRHTSASNSGFITGLFVLFVPLAERCLGRRIAPLAWTAVGLALCGLWLVTGGARGLNRGDALTLVSAAAYAGHLLATQRCVRQDHDPVLLSFHQFWITGALCLVLGPFPPAWPRPGGWAPIVFLALLPTLSAFFIQLRAQSRRSALRVSLAFSLEPVFAALLAWTLGRESFRAPQALGGLLIVAGMLLHARARAERTTA